MKRILWLAVLVTAWCVNVPAPAQIAGGAASLRRLVSAVRHWRAELQVRSTEVIDILGQELALLSGTSKTEAIRQALIEKKQRMQLGLRQDRKVRRKLT